MTRALVGPTSEARVEAGFLQSPLPDVNEIQMVAITTTEEDVDYFDFENHSAFGPSSEAHTTSGLDIARAELDTSDESATTTSSIVNSDVDMPRDAQVQHLYIGEPYGNPTEYPPPFLAPPSTQAQRLRPVPIYYQIQGEWSWFEDYFDFDNRSAFGPSSEAHTMSGPDVARAELDTSDESATTTSSVVNSDVDMPRDARVQHFYIGEPYGNPTEYPPPFLAPPFTQPRSLRPIRIYYQVQGEWSWFEEF